MSVRDPSCASPEHASASTPHNNDPNTSVSHEPNASAPDGHSNHVFVCLLGYSLSFIIFGSQVSILGPTIGSLSERLGVDEPALSPLFTALGVSCIISGAPSGWIVDMYPTHYVLLCSLLVQAIGFAIVPLMPSVWSLTALWFVICFSYNFTNSAVFASLTWMFPGHAGGALNMVLSMFGIGSFLIPLAANECHNYLGSALSVFYLISALCLLSMLPFFFVPSPKCPSSCDSDSQDLKSECTTSKQHTWETVITVSCVLIVGFSTTAETCVGNWINTYAQDVVGLERQDAAWVNSAFWGCFTLGRIIGALIARYTSPAGLLLSFTPLSVIGTSIPMILELRGSPMTHASVLAMAVLAGLGNAAGYANAVALLERNVIVTGTINGIFGMVAGGACMVGPNLVALLSSVYSTTGADGSTVYWFQAMSWVGLAFYTLHFPAIFSALVAGQKLRACAFERVTDADKMDVEQPLLNGSHEEEAALTPIRRSFEEGVKVVINGCLSPRPSNDPSPLLRAPSTESTPSRQAYSRISFPGHMPLRRSQSIGRVSSPHPQDMEGRRSMSRTPEPQGSAVPPQNMRHTHVQHETHPHTASE